MSDATGGEASDGPCLSTPEHLREPINGILQTLVAHADAGCRRNTPNPPLTRIQALLVLVADSRIKRVDTIVSIADCCSVRVMTTRRGILATGRIAHTSANAINTSSTAELVAVGSRTQEKAEKFASDYDGIKAHGTYDGLLADPNIDAIYVSTPHPQHVEWTIKALDSGKAVLCEKPMGLNHAEVMAMVHAAQVNHCFLLEASMYRMNPQTQQIRTLWVKLTSCECYLTNSTKGATLSA